jgi:hypothetical protein
LENKWKNYHIFLDSLFPNTETKAKFYLRKQNNPKVNNSHTRIYHAEEAATGEQKEQTATSLDLET